MKQDVQISPSTVAQMKYEKRQREIAQHRKNFAIKIKPSIKNALSRIKKSCGYC